MERNPRGVPVGSLGIIPAWKNPSRNPKEILEKHVGVNGKAWREFQQ